MRARIYKQPKAATQSGMAGTENWVLEFEPSAAERNEPLMGWWGSGDMRNQVRLRFETREEAIAYVERHGIPYDLALPPPRRMRPKAYADNFRFGRSENWTH